MKIFNLGLKDNWRAFKEFVESQKNSLSTPYYFVIREGDCGDGAHVFTSQSDLDKWLEEMFWSWGRYDTTNLEDSMNDVKVWKLISESDVQELDILYRGSKRTSISINGKQYYRKLISVSVEPTVIVSTNWY